MPLLYFVAWKKLAFWNTWLLLSFPDSVKFHDYPQFSDWKLSLSNPNLTISQPFKKNYQIFWSSWGHVSLIYIFITYPSPQFSWYLETHQAIHHQVNIF